MTGTFLEVLGTDRRFPDARWPGKYRRRPSLQSTMQELT